MRFCSLVPALACLASAAFAADTPAVKIDGFVDTWLSSTNNELGGGSSGFGYAGKLGFAGTITDKVALQIDAVIDGSSNTASFRQAYGTWAITPDITLKTGKFISDYGWTAPYAPGLFRVNAGPIVAFYGVDQVGANVKYTKGDLTAAVTVANGFFGEGSSSSSQTAGQANEAYAWGLDVAYSLGDKGTVNAEAIVDQGAVDGGLKESNGDGYHFAVNATITPTKDLTAGVEGIYQFLNVKDAKDETHAGLMAMANYKLALSIPASVTAMYQFTEVNHSSTGVISSGVLSTGDSVDVNELSLALLTSPAGTDKLGVNFEVNYTSWEVDGADATWALGCVAEVLYVLP